MPSPAVARLLDQVQDAINDFAVIPNRTPLLENYLAKFLVVYISGIYEEAIETLIIEFVENQSTRKEVVDFFKTSVGRSFRNPSPENIKQLISNFQNSVWTGIVTGMTTDERFGLRSINENKTSIAHGSASTITLMDVTKYYQDTRPLIERLSDGIV